MLDTLQKMSGVTHKVVRDSKNVTQDLDRLVFRNEAKVSYNIQAKEMPVISLNDMAFIQQQNSIVFSAGQPVIWNRQQSTLPMSWQLYKNTIKQPGQNYTLQTLPTTSSAADFDVRQNQPDFMKMLRKRIDQAVLSEKCQTAYKEAFGYNDYDISKLSLDDWADDIMNFINEELRGDNELEDPEEDFYDDDEWEARIEDDEEFAQAMAEAAQKSMDGKECRYAGKRISRDDLYKYGNANHAWDETILNVYNEVRGDMEQDDKYFKVTPQGLCNLSGTVLIAKVSDAESSRWAKAFNQAAQDANSSVYAEATILEKDVKRLGSMVVTDAFYEFLTSLDSWTFARGRFEAEFKHQLELDEAD